MRYAKIINSRVIAEAPKHGSWDNKIYGNLYAHPEVLVAMGYKPLIESEKPVVGERERLVTTYEDNGEAIVEVHKIEQLPPQDRTLSKMRLFEALYRRNYWDVVKAYIKQDEYTQNVWSFAVTLQEQHELVRKAIAGLQLLCNVSDEEIEAIIQESEAI